VVRRRHRHAIPAAILIVAALVAGAETVLGGWSSGVGRADGVVIIRLPQLRPPTIALGEHIRPSVVGRLDDSLAIDVLRPNESVLAGDALAATKFRLKDLSEGQLGDLGSSARVEMAREQDYVVGQQLFATFREGIVAGGDRAEPDARLALLQQAVGGTGPDLAALPDWVTDYLTPAAKLRLSAAELAGPGVDSYVPIMAGDPG
jgi:hypothetical protein